MMFFLLKFVCFYFSTIRDVCFSTTEVSVLSPQRRCLILSLLNTVCAHIEDDKHKDIATRMKLMLHSEYVRLDNPSSFYFAV